VAHLFLVAFVGGTSFLVAQLLVAHLVAHLLVAFVLVAHLLWHICSGGTFGASSLLEQALK
jgi:hypothetical protein